MIKVLRILTYIAKIYTSSVVLSVLFFIRKYSVEINHVESKHTGLDTWLTTLTPDTIVFESEKSFIHVHKIRFYRKK
ncbi:hypothetical protein [Mesoaciditoga sp.]